MSSYRPIGPNDHTFGPPDAPYAGANAGANASGVSSADMSRMQDMLTPGQAAIVLVVDDPYGKDLQTALQGDNGTGGLVTHLTPH